MRWLLISAAIYFLLMTLMIITVSNGPFFWENLWWKINL